MAVSLAPKNISFHLVQETVAGTVNTSPVFKRVRRNSGHAINNISYVQSSEVALDDQPVEQIPDTATYIAEIEFDATKQTFNYLPKAIQADEVLLMDDTGVDVATTSSSITQTAATAFATSVAGDFFHASGFTDPLNDGWYQITVVNGAGSVDVLPVPNSVESAGATVVLTSYQNISAGTIYKFTGQTRIADLTKAGNIDYRTNYSGPIDALKFEIPESGLVTGSATIKFEKQVAGTAVVAGQTDATTDTSGKIHATNHVKAFWVNGVKQDCVIKSMGFEFAQNFNEDKAAACPGAEYIGGTKTLGGSLVSRLKTADSLYWRDRYEAGTQVSLAFEIEHDDGTYTLISIPRAKITAHSIPDSNGAVSVSEMTYAAEITSCTQYSNWAL